MNGLSQFPPLGWLALHAAPAAWCVYHALLYKRDSRSALGWIMASLFIPYAGPLAYFLFGINRVRSRAHAIRRPFFSVGYEIAMRPSAGWPEEVALGSRISVAGQRISGSEAVGGNQVRPLFNGDEAYPAMLEAIAGARHRVLFATYIMRRDRTGRAFVEAFAAAARRGVDVRCIVDGVGELYAFPGSAPLLRAGGVKVARFLPPRLIPPSIYVNLRNHRKLLVVDSEVAFTGGMNVGDDNVADEHGEREVSDVHFALAGPVVSRLAGTFMDDWRFAMRRSTDDLPDPPPPSRASGEAVCRVLPDGPDMNLDVIALAVQTAISGARRSVDIMTPYFVPSRELMATLVCAALRGVRVRVVLPAANNLVYVHWANRNILAELLLWDIEIYYQPAPFCHSKLLCVDDAYTLIGSANLDPRSLRLNFEIGVEVFSPALCASLRRHVDEVAAGSSRLAYETLAKRSIPVRLRDSAAALFSPYL